MTDHSPKPNEWLEDDVSDLLFGDADASEESQDVMLAPQYRAVLLEYMGGQPPVTQEQCNMYLAGLASGMTHIAAAKQAGAAYTTFHRLRKSNEVFALAVQEAMEIRAEFLRDVSIDQAVNGVRTKNGLTFPTNPQLIMHIKAAFPDEYRDRSEVVERKGEDVQPIGREGDREKLIKMIEKHGVKDDGDDVADLL